MWNFSKKLLFIVLFFVRIFISAQELPPVENFSPETYGADNQNWAISQSDEKYIYVANNNGLLEYNGEEWSLYESPNNTIIRSVNVYDNRIYTGYHMEFGYWEKNDFGLLQYNSLSKKLDKPLIDDESFWNIIKFENWILFQSLNRIYIYNTIDETFNIINSKTVLYKIFEVNRSIYFQKLNDGIYKIERGKEVLVSNDPVFQNNILVNIYNINGNTIFLTQDAGFFILEDGNLTKWNNPINNVVLNKRVFSSIQLENGDIILGTVSNGMYQVDINGKVITAINQEKGLNNNTVLSIYEDRDHNLWLGLDNGISVINLKSPFSVYNDITGKLGTVYASILYDDKLYLGTNQGLFYKEFNTNEDFKFIEGTSGQVWSLEIFDNTLFCGHNTGTFIINNNSATLICDVMGAWDFESIEDNPSLLLQGNYDGLYVLEKKGNTWGLRNKIEGFENISCRQIYLNKPNQLFMNHEFLGLFKLILDKDYRKVYTKVIDHSAPKSLKSGIVNYNNNLYYVSNSGIFKFNSSKDIFIKDTLLTSDFLQHDSYVSGKLIVDDKNNTLWGFTNKSISYFTPGELSDNLKINKILIPKSLRRDVSGYECLTHLNNQFYLFGTSRGYIILDLDKTNYFEFEVTLNTIKSSVLNGERKPVSLIESGSFNSIENNMYFSYSVPEFDKYLTVNYQYKLDGIYKDWSHWSSASSISFENLPYGKYTFRVHAQIGNKISKNAVVYNFTINRPWYISNLMIGVYIVLLLLLVILIHLIYKRNFNRQKQMFLEKKQSEFALSQLKTEKVIMNLKNEKLQNEIESKSRELGASTMNIIKKNEFLNTLKNELTSLKTVNDVKSIIKMINQDMAKNSDWEMFQEAFNNADSDFLKKIKSVHPTLTPNDLRLCAYLRLNLSSKEIAPLLNISTRSVEIKRYRLRKKLELNHEESLVEYILGI